MTAETLPPMGIDGATLLAAVVVVALLALVVLVSYGAPRPWVCGMCHQKFETRAEVEHHEADHRDSALLPFLLCTTCRHEAAQHVSGLGGCVHGACECPRFEAVQA